MKPKHNYPKIRGRITERYGTISAFASAVGISDSMMSRKLCGKAAISVKDMYKWGELLGIDESDFVAYFIQKI